MVAGGTAMSGYFNNNVEITSHVNLAYDKTDDQDDLTSDERRTSNTSMSAITVSTDPEPRAPPKRSAFLGILCSMASSVFFTLTAAIVKYLKDVHPGW